MTGSLPTPVLPKLMMLALPVAISGTGCESPLELEAGGFEAVVSSAPSSMYDVTAEPTSLSLLKLVRPELGDARYMR